MLATNWRKEIIKILWEGALVVLMHEWRSIEFYDIWKF